MSAASFWLQWLRKPHAPGTFGLPLPVPYRWMNAVPFAALDLWQPLPLTLPFLRLGTHHRLLFAVRGLWGVRLLLLPDPLFPLHVPPLRWFRFDPTCLLSSTRVEVSLPLLPPVTMAPGCGPWLGCAVLTPCRLVHFPPSPRRIKNFAYYRRLYPMLR